MIFRQANLGKVIFSFKGRHFRDAAVLSLIYYPGNLYTYMPTREVQAPEYDVLQLV